MTCYLTKSKLGIRIRCMNKKDELTSSSRPQFSMSKLSNCTRWNTDSRASQPLVSNFVPIP